MQSQNKKIFPKCDNCHSSDAELLYQFYDEIDSFYDKKKRLMTVAQCRVCKLVYAHIFQSKADRQHIDEIFFDETHLHEEGESRTIRDFNKVLEKITKYGGRGKLLDIGCGTGYFLKFAQDKGWQVEGVEISKLAVKHARKLGLNVKNMSLEQAKYPSNCFSAITQLGLIEHVTCPRKLLQETSRILKPNGILVIFTPNAGSLFHKLAHLYYKLTGSYFAIKKIYYSRHLYYFTRNTLTSILEKEGFMVKEIQMVSLDMNKQFFQLFRKQRWAHNPLLKFSAYIVLWLSKLTKTESHMLFYAIKQ